VQSLKDAAQDRERSRFEEIEALEQRRLENEEMFAQMSYAQAKESAQAKAMVMQGYASTALSITAGASQQLISDLVGQQEQALERFGVSVMAQAGQALVAYGAQAIGRGILELSSPLTAPLAAASFTAGGVLVGAGIGLGGVAGGLGSLLGAAGGGPGASERGVPSGFSGGATGGGGGTSIQIIYGGASGPTADHAVSAVSDTITRASARNALRPEVR